MGSRLVAATLAIASLGWGCEPPEVARSVEKTRHGHGPRIAEEIRETYESRFDELDLNYQSHFAVRMHRARGASDHVEAVATDMASRLEDFDELLAQAHDPLAVREIANRTLWKKPQLTVTQRERRKMFGERPEFLFHRRVLFTAHKMRDTGLHKGELASTYEAAQAHLREVDFARFLLDPDVIRPYAAQTSNLVFWLKRVDAVDLEAEYTDAFRDVFMNADDDELTKADYQNKLYGLTHFIIADSHYYQRLVPAEKYQWILDYFDRHLLEILSWSKPDIIAEIALCFRLCGLHDHPAVHQATDYLVRAYDPELGFIPGPAEINFNTSEHRNAVAYLVMNPWTDLTPGPFLTAEMLSSSSSPSAR